MNRPVFVIGSPRSGTTLMYHMLLSAGGFAIYDAESNVFSMLSPTFGNLHRKNNRQELMNSWLKSHLFRASNLDGPAIERRILAECNNAGDFLRILMDEIMRHQHVHRWADQTPSHIFHMREIKKYFPDALFVHMIRDGRDVALSMGKPGWVQTLPGHSHKIRLAAGLFWDWAVRKGREQGRQNASDYIEIRYEELVLQPESALARLRPFLRHELDYDQIQRTAFGSVGRPNTSFVAEQSTGRFSPVGRWKSALGRLELAELEGLIGELLLDLEYPLASGRPIADPRSFTLRALYRTYFESMLWLKKSTPMHRFLASHDLDHRMFHAAQVKVDLSTTR